VQGEEASKKAAAEQQQQQQQRVSTAAADAVDRCREQLDDAIKECRSELVELQASMEARTNHLAEAVQEGQAQVSERARATDR